MQSRECQEFPKGILWFCVLAQVQLFMFVYILQKAQKRNGKAVPFSDYTVAGSFSFCHTRPLG
jgi:hypothetical protein